MLCWLLRSRRGVVNCERNVQASETLIEVAMIRLPIALVGQGRFPEWLEDRLSHHIVLARPRQS